MKLYVPAAAPLEAEAVATFVLLDVAVRPSKTLLVVDDSPLSDVCRAVRYDWMLLYADSSCVI